MVELSTCLHELLDLACRGCLQALHPPLQALDTLVGLASGVAFVLDLQGGPTLCSSGALMGGLDFSASAFGGRVTLLLAGIQTRREVMDVPLGGLEAGTCCRVSCPLGLQAGCRVGELTLGLKSRGSS